MRKVTKHTTGVKVSGAEVFEISLKNSRGTEVQILNYGATLQSFIVLNKYQQKQNVVLGLAHAADYLQPDFIANNSLMGAVVGRYANRIKNAQFNLNHKTYSLNANIGSDALHGGLQGFDKKVWQVEQYAADPEPNVTLTYISPDNEEHYPGNLKVELNFSLNEDNALSLRYRALSDADTIINLTHHDYFNLNINQELIGNHLHQLFSSKILVQDDNFCATGAYKEVVESPLDFNTAKRMDSHWDARNGYDQSYVLDKKLNELGLASITRSLESGLSLWVYTTEPVVHFYTGKYLDVPTGIGNQRYKAFQGFCLECQHHPNAVNIPFFPNTVLRKNELYAQTTIYKIALDTDATAHEGI